MISAALRDFDRLWREEEPDLLTAALQVARIGYPDLDVAVQMERVARLAAAAGDRLANAPSEHTQLLRFNHFFFEELGFRGDQLDYFHPRNSFLNVVLDRRSGIPISLSVLYVVIGRQAGLHLSGIGLPAHFVVRHEAADPAFRVYVDPFNCQILPNREACRRLVRQVSGQELPLDEDTFAPQPVKSIVLRMLANLKGAYVRLHDFPMAAATLDRILLLLPEDAHQWRDRGLLHYQMGNLRQASFDLMRCLWLADGGDQEQREAAGLLHRIHETMLSLN